MTEPVLILFNEPQSLEQTSSGCPYESDAGVLKEVEAVAGALKSLGVEHRRGCVRTLREVERLLSACPEKVVVNLVERLGPSVFDACLVPAVCEAAGKVYTGNGAVAQILALDKWLTKAVLQAHGVSVPRACVIQPEAQIFDPGGGAKALIVKPLRSDASEGIDASSVVSVGNFRGLERAVLRVHRQFQQPALVEEYIEGREINVSLLEKDGKLLLLPLAEIDFSAFPPGKPRIVDYAAKWLENSFEYDNTPRKIPAALEENTATRVRACAMAAWHGLGCRDYARVDIRLDEQGQPYVVEVNPNPDIAPDAGFAAALEAGGISFPEFVATLIENALRTARGISVKPARAKEKKEQVPIELRWSRVEDEKEILRTVEASGVFRRHEIEVAREVLSAALAAGPDGHYQSYTALANGRVAGWVCFGPTPCTEGTFDIYWIVVDPNFQRVGIASALLVHAEEEVRRRGGRLSVIETSSRAVYEPARRFYVRHGYREAARVSDFYARGDDKIIFVKSLRATPEL